MLTIINNDCLTAMREMADNSIDAIVTDPPYGLSFMGKKWDYDVPSVEIWREAFRVLKPGGHLLAFAGTRTQHRMAVNIEDAGFDIRDMIMWVYGSGFPKSLDIGKAIDKAAGAEREVVGEYNAHRDNSIRKPKTYLGISGEGLHGLAGKKCGGMTSITAPATPEARQWNGWGTALKPAVEPITVARKPVEGTVAENVLKWGTGGINIDGCRVETKKGDEISNHGRKSVSNGWDPRLSGDQVAGQTSGQKLGRFPANFIHDGSDEVVGMFSRTTSGAAAKTRNANDDFWNGKKRQPDDPEKYNGGDSGSAARFFYTAKASKTERDAGCEGLEPKQMDESRKQGNIGGDNPRNRGVQEKTNHHPTVKPIDLMRYLCRLVTPPGGTILDPFAGSGTTLVAAHYEGFSGIGIEREKEYAEIAEKRIAAHTAQTRLF